MKSDLRKRRQAQRRLQRVVMLNHMVLHGWVPVQINAQWGIYHPETMRLVLRRWYVDAALQAQSAFPYPHKRVPPPPGRWTYQCTLLSLPFEGNEVQWTDIQRRWVHALRAAAIQRGWL